MTEKVTAAQLSMMLADEIEAVVRDLGITVSSSDRRRLYCFAPWSNHHKPKLEIGLSPIPGKWNDWIEGRYGDALGLVGCTLTGQADHRTHAARIEGIAWARERYGIGSQTFDRDAWARNRAAAAVRAKEREQAAANELKRFRGIAEHIWIHADNLRPTSRAAGGHILKGCDGARYLEARGIDFGRLGRLPRAVKFGPATEWRGKGGAEYVGPALVSAMTLPDGKFGSVHRTWIDPDHEGEKAALDPPRKMWPDSEGAAIRLWRGEGFLTPKEALERGITMPQAVGEGVEDGLSVALMIPEYRVDAAGSLPGLLSYVPPECASELLVLADNDWNKPQAQALLERAIERLKALGKPVKVARSPEGKDFNDLLRGVE